MQVKRDILWRVYISFIGLTLLGGTVVGRAFYIQYFQGAHWRKLSDSLHQRYVTLDAQRGTIYSEDGQLLSTSLPTFDIYLDLCADGLREDKGLLFRDNIDSFSVALASLFKDQTAAQYKEAITAAYEKKSRYYPLKKKISFAEYKVFREFKFVQLGTNRSGVIVEANSKRLMPYGILAGRTIGLSREHIDSDGKIRKQNVGLERSYDSLLSGKAGTRLVRFIAGGAAIPVEGFDTEPENGKDIYTTIDLRMQDITETALMRMMVQSEATYGTAIIMETSTGKIKAMANLGRRPDGHYWEDDNYALRTTEPGSTIKLATLLAVLEKGTSKIDDEVEIGTAGRAKVGPKVVIDAERSPKSVLTVRECYSHSSNIGMSKLALKAFGSNPQEIKTYFQKFRLDKPVDIDLSSAHVPIMAPLTEKGSAVGNMLWMSFGYAIQISPLHTLTLYNAVANGGKMMKPYLVSRIQQGEAVYREIEPTVLDEQICRPEVIAAARTAMEAVVTEGTGRRAFADMPFSVAGKTGTALVADGPIKYDDRVFQASFVGYFPANQPQYTCIVLVRTKPFAASHYGGTVAAPVFREIATKVHAMFVERKDPSAVIIQNDTTTSLYTGPANAIRKIFQSLQLPYPDSIQGNAWIMADQQPGGTTFKTQEVANAVIPDVTGMGLKDALNLLENLGIKVQIRGRGKVVSQSVTPGTVLDRSQEIILDLN